MNKKMKRSVLFNIPGLAALAVFVALVIFLASCTSGSIRGTAIKITSPRDGVSAGDIEVKVDVTNFDLVDKEGMANNLGEGHIIYYLDVKAPTYYDYPAITKDGTYKTSDQTSFTWTGVTPGLHTFSAQLVGNNNKPLPAPAVDSVDIMVQAPEGEPSISIETPEDGSELPPGIIIILVSVDNFIISKSDMGAINNTGEGHLIFYLDEDPPDSPGEPALTTTSIVSTDTGYMWKKITDGQHSFAVQLVNNDDTPLDPPVWDIVSLSIKE